MALFLSNITIIFLFNKSTNIMKKLFILTALTLFNLASFAQLKTNIVVFSEQGEQFYLVLNGIQQNAEAQTNVKVTDLIQPYYKVKIMFPDGNQPQIDKNINFNQGTETTFCLKKNKKGEYVLRWQSEVPIAQAPPPTPNQNVVVYTTTPPPAASTSVTYTETSTTVVNGNPPTGDNVSMGVNINDNETGVNINMNMNAGGTSTQSSSYTSTTTTTTSSGTYSETPPAQQVYVMPGYNGPTGCAWPMDDNQFSSAYSSVASKDFDDSKLIIAKQIIGSNCLTCNQVKQMMLLLDFEDNRLDLAKFAYGYTYDIGNYYMLNDAFDFESTIEELDEYVRDFSW